ncbi:MAG: MATE family efflux transporter [Clostridia bacterium]|nr:MATE family efflux transporter [Clostridia bacterium]
MDKRIYTMSQEKPYKAVVKMGVPVTMGMLFMVAYNLVDTYFIGLLHDDYQLAAVNFAYPVLMILIAIAGIVGNGGASYIARCLGAKKMEEAEHTLTIGFELIILSSIVITALGLLLIDPLVNLLGTESNTFGYTKDYCSVMFIGSIFTMGNYAIGQLLRSEGSTFYSMVGMISGTLANIILDPIFIFTLGLETKGAAIATVLGNLVGVLVFLWYYARRKTILEPSIKYRKLDGAIIKEIMWVGIPHTLEQIFVTMAMVVNNNLAAAYSEITVAAMGVANKIMSFGQYIYQGMAAGCQPLMGFNFGAKNYSRMRKIMKSGVLVITLMELVVVAIFGIFAPSLIGLFTESEMVIEIGAMTLRAFMIYLIFVGSTSIVRNTFNAIGKPIYAFGITIVRQLILYIPFLLLFNNLWGYNGLIYAQPAEEFICMILSLILLSKYLQKYESKERENDK